jgi:hypothetical protein
VDSGQEVDDLEVEETNDEITDEITDAKDEQKVLFPETSVLSQIKNKLRRREMYVKLKKQKKEVCHPFTQSLVSFVLTLVLL